MKYTKFDEIKKEYIIGKNHTRKRESKAEWKDDIGIPFIQLDTDYIIEYIRITGNATEFLMRNAFIVIHNELGIVYHFVFIKIIQLDLFFLI